MWPKRPEANHLLSISQLIGYLQRAIRRSLSQWHRKRNPCFYSNSVAPARNIFFDRRLLAVVAWNVKKTRRRARGRVSIIDYPFELVNQEGIYLDDEVGPKRCPT